MSYRKGDKFVIVAIGSDHAAFDLRYHLIDHLKERGIEVKDFGTYENRSCDYPVYAHLVANAVVNGEADFGILVCGTGIGMSMAANKVKGIRAALVGDELSAEATRLHNDANVLCMGARVTTHERAERITDIFLDTPFSNEEKHIRRIGGIEQ